MTGGGLYDPLGTAAVAAGPRWRPSGTLITAGVVVAVLAIVGIAVALRGGDERGEPHAVVTIERLPAPAPPASAASPALPAAPASIQPAPPVAGPIGPAASGDADVEVQNGVRIIRMHPAPGRPSAQPVPPPPATAGIPGRSGTQGSPH